MKIIVDSVPSELPHFGANEKRRIELCRPD